MVSVKTLFAIIAFAMCINLIVGAKNSNYEPSKEKRGGYPFVKKGARKADTEDYEDEFKAMAAASKTRHEERQDNVRSILSKEKVDPSRRPPRHEERKADPYQNKKRVAPVFRGLPLTSELTGELAVISNGNSGRNCLF